MSGCYSTAPPFPQSKGASFIIFRNMTSVFLRSGYVTHTCSQMRRASFQHRIWGDSGCSGLDSDACICGDGTGTLRVIL